MSVAYVKINVFRKHCLTKIKPLRFLYQPIDFLWSARSYSKTILPTGVVARARFTSGDKAIRWLRLRFWITVVIGWGAHRGIASVPGTARWRNLVVSGPRNVIWRLRYSIGHIHSRIGGNSSYKIDISETWLYIWPVSSRVIFGCIQFTGARQGNLKGVWTSVCFWICIAYFRCWNAAHKLFFKKNLPSHRKNSAKPKGPFLSRLSKIWSPFALCLVLLYYRVTGLSSMIVALLGFVSHPFFSCKAPVRSFPTASACVPVSVR